MTQVAKEAFKKRWVRAFTITLGVVELVCVIIFILTELGNVASNFWTTNVFAGTWCGLVMFIHGVFLIVTGKCLDGR